MTGNIKSPSNKSTDQQAKFPYTANVEFREATNIKDFHDLSPDDINESLANRSTIPCQASIAAYNSLSYFSKTMHVPVKSILKEVNKPLNSN